MMTPLIHWLKLQTRLPLGLKSGEAGSPLDTLALLNCCCSCRILGATGPPEPEPDIDDIGCCCEWMSTAAVTRDADDGGCSCPPPPYPYKSPPGGGAAPPLLSGRP